MSRMPNLYRRAIFTGLLIMLVIYPAMASRVDVAQLTARQANRIIQENRQNRDFTILDIRTPKEYAQGHIAGAVLLDYYSPAFVDGLRRLDKSKTYLIYCRSGNRSARTLKMIEKMNFDRIYHMQSGIIDWVKNRYALVR